jgi:hypothetical protein
MLWERKIAIQSVDAFKTEKGGERLFKVVMSVQYQDAFNDGR